MNLFISRMKQKIMLLTMLLILLTAHTSFAKGKTPDTPFDGFYGYINFGFVRGGDRHGGMYNNPTRYSNFFNSWDLVGLRLGLQGMYYKKFDLAASYGFGGEIGYLTGYYFGADAHTKYIHFNIKTELMVSIVGLEVAGGYYFSLYKYTNSAPGFSAAIRIGYFQNRIEFLLDDEKQSPNIFWTFAQISIPVKIF